MFGGSKGKHNGKLKPCLIVGTPKKHTVETRHWICRVFTHGSSFASPNRRYVPQMGVPFPECVGKSGRNAFAHLLFGFGLSLLGCLPG